MIKILFICLGNICRSPMAEAVFKKMIEDENLEDKVFVDSAATSSWEVGNPVHTGTKNRLAKENISVKGMYARKLNDTDLDFNYLICMDKENISDIKYFVGNKKSGKIIRLLELADISRDIEDPYYTNNYDKTYDDVVIGCEALLEIVKKDLNKKYEK